MNIFVINNKPMVSGGAGEQIYEKNLFTSLFAIVLFLDAF
jgi:hypothetical protein